MAKRKSSLLGSGKKNVTDNALLMTVGFIGGVGTDAFYSSLKLPGYNSEVSSCRQLTFGDIFQIAIYGTLTFFGVLYTRKNLANFAFGLLTGKLFPTVFTGSFKDYGVPRYVLFDINPETGNIEPKFNITDTLRGLADGLRGAPANISENISENITKNLSDQLRNIPGIPSNSSLAKAYATQIIGASPTDIDLEVTP